MALADSTRHIGAIGPKIPGRMDGDGLFSARRFCLHSSGFQKIDRSSAIVAENRADSKSPKFSFEFKSANF
ncbi:hypothetical protein ACVW1A_006062 [Bradyrhizobium sp. LB1.3]|jgi:hypothetical protein